MAYFLKRTRNKKGTYLQIYTSRYDPDRRQTVHRSVRAVGYVHELEASGIADPVAHFRAEVDRMNAERRQEAQGEKERRIGEQTPERLLGHFPLKAVNEALGVEGDFSYLQVPSGLRFSLYDLASSLTYARAVAPCSKRRTFHDVLPRLGGAPAFSLDQLYAGLAYLGEEYEKVVEIYNARVSGAFGGRDASTLYFDCTNFYFEIDAEDGLRRKGPSKERRTDPIVGLGLLLDANQIPVGMKVFPGNESEKPKLREVVDDLKRRGGVGGRTVRVADKGLNCADNVAAAVLDGDGYLFSKSVRQLPEAEQAWALADEGFVDVAGGDGETAYRLKSCVGGFTYRVTGEDGRKRDVELTEKRLVTYNPALARKQRREIDRQVEKARKLRLAGAKRAEYGDSSKFVAFRAVDADGCVGDGEVAATLDHDAIERARRLAGYNMLVTSETAMPDAEVYRTYHNLWRIEESFRVMKSQLDARPVYLQKRSTITGHFLVCYLAVLLLRLLQFEVLGSRFSSEEIMECARGFRAVRVSERRFVNVSRTSPLLDELERLTGLPIQNYNLTKGQVDDILSYRFQLKAKPGRG